MAEQLDHSFLENINVNLGIAHKVLRLYFSNAHEREDALQEMMYQLWRSYPSFDGKSRFSTWMYKVCLNTALTIRRKDKQKPEALLLDSYHQIAAETPENKEEAMTQLLDAIAKLSPLNKAIVLLYLEDLSYDEIAAVVGLSRSNVSVRLVRIKKELETRLR